MGLKAVHIAFIIFCVGFFGATMVISLREYFAGGPFSLVLVAASCVVCGAILIPYSKRFLNKLKDIGYM